MLDEKEVIIGESSKEGMKNDAFSRLTLGMEKRQGEKNVLDI